MSGTRWSTDRRSASRVTWTRAGSTCTWKWIRATTCSSATMSTTWPAAGCPWTPSTARTASQAPRRVHGNMEMDSRSPLQVRNYGGDRASGRLPVDAVHRTNVQPRPVPADGTFRLGASDPRIRDLQRVMDGEGYRAADGGPLDR